MKELSESTVGDQIASLIRDVEDLKDQINKLQGSKPAQDVSPKVQDPKPVIHPNPVAAPVETPENAPSSPPKPTEKPDKNSVTLIPEQL